MASEPDSLEAQRRKAALAPAKEASQARALMLQEPTPEAPIPFGRYQLIRRIGAGGMGEVFLAREAGAEQRAVVVKKVLPNLIANRAFVGRFLDEARVVVRLKHPNIARVHAMGDEGGEYFLSMEYVQGKTVSRFTRRLRDRKLDLPLGVTLLLGERVCQGLQYAHDARDEAGNPLHLVHRDLSPANVCISYKGEVKIIDFGAAQSTLKEEQTAPRVVIGNLTYMAPEQAKKQIVDGRADIYSCGVMLWELLSWHALPQKGDPIERWRKAANPSWAPPSQQQPAVPRAVDEVILKALKKEPKDRYATAVEFGEALKKLRQRYAPKVTDKDLGALLARVFAKEKAGEDEVLHEAVYGRTANLARDEKTKRVVLVPPTALAFEHTAVLASADFLPDDQDVTDPGEGLSMRDRGTPTGPDPRLVQPQARARRAGFGVTFGEVEEPVIERSLVQEIEADGFEEPSDPEADTRADAPVPRGWWRYVVLFGGIFFFAAGLGFLGVWLALR